jgi:hypothetical protein
MSKLALAVAVIVLAGCASMGEWRTLSIDSTSESAFADSVSLLDQELPNTHRTMFRLALVDIARTGVQNAGEADDGGPAYTDEDFHAELNGLTYEGVIALADQSGTPIWKQYYSGLRPPTVSFSDPQPFYGNDQFWPVSNPGLILSDAWKEPGFSPGNFSPLD